MTPKRRNNSTDKATSTSNASKLSKPPNRKVSSRLPHGDIKPANVPKRKLNRTKDADERNGDVKPASVPKRKFNSKKGDEELLPSQQKRVKYSQDGSPQVAKARKDNVRKNQSTHRRGYLKEDTDSDVEFSDAVSDSEFSSESSCSSSGTSVISSSTLSAEPRSGIYVRYAQKVEKAMKALDDKMKKLNFRSVERHIMFNAVVGKCRKAIIKEKTSLRPRDGRERRTWEFMFNSWLAYAEKYPHRKNTISVKKNRKLASWVHEQRKKIVKSILHEDRLALLVGNGFIFQPRQHEQQSLTNLVEKHKGMFTVVLLLCYCICMFCLCCSVIFFWFLAMQAKQVGIPRKNGGNSNVKSSRKQLTNTSESLVPPAVEGIDRMPNGDPGVVLDTTTGR